MGILSGLGNMGIDIKDGDLFAEEKKEGSVNPEELKKAEEQKKQTEEADNLLKKSYNCPICGGAFKALTVKANRARLIAQDIDLRPKYEKFDALKYAAIMCPNCGYASRGQIFNDVSTKQKAVIREKIASNYFEVNDDEKLDVYDYDTAINHYQMAIGTAIVRNAKNSEKAYICLQTAWVVRGKKESLDPKAPDYASQLKECQENEKELLQNAMEGFIKARSSEDFPMCGMDEYTIDYIIAALCYECGKLEVGLKLLGELISSRTTNSRIKDKARNLRDLIVQKSHG